MFDGLININIDTCSDSELITLIRQISSLHAQATVELARRFENNNQVNVSEDTDRAYAIYNKNKPAEENNTPQIVAIVNGRKIHPKSLSEINENNYDVILDISTNSLRYRKDPLGHSPLLDARCEGIGKTRIAYLIYMFGHPNIWISADNNPVLTELGDSVQANTLAKTMNLLRNTLGQQGSKGPYIITEQAWGNESCSYRINTQWKYKVIRNKKS